ncbi:double-strand break repair protein AddB [Tritonibacter horizontis]|uniref:PD-(D/E)XK nuclease superfamily protein n=1 Tax=Tritonibacter horizontis TaxID=1768241 RepID=A0A132C2I0_9RHOB|nr:double-strand break repair protein AddB [Tritonibacter horizontis]KUP94799.1 PD-(D/E)XK nuclease superfamily protein [Tritonibacter horizontis]
MFDSQGGKPRIFAVPCGVDFPKALVTGLLQRFAGQPPEALARVELILNTERMQRRVRQLFDSGPAALLPRVSLLSGLSRHADLRGLPPALPPLRRRLELSQLIAKLLDAQPDLAARASLYDLSDSLAALIDEMQSEGVTTDKIRALDVSDMSGHWARAQSFIGIADEFVDLHDGALDVNARQRQMVLNLIDEWSHSPPQHPVLLAGSTGSRGTTLLLMEAIARLPQGAVILPGYDFDQPDAVWDSLSDALVAEDHPQFRFCKLMRDLDLEPQDIHRWTDTPPNAPARNRLISLALRPAPVTDAWMSEGPSLRELDKATEALTLVEADTPRSEALAIALRLRQAAEDGQTAALITPDRMLTRQVSAALDRWNILPDDSAGLPLQLSPPGRFLRHVADLYCRPLQADMVLTILKHPLTHSGASRGPHLRHARDLELHMRRYGPPFPDGDALRNFGLGRDLLTGWADWLADNLSNQNQFGVRPLSAWVATLRHTAETLAAGSQTSGSGELWEKNAGIAARAVLDDLEAEAPHGGEMNARDFADLLGALLGQSEVRDRDAPYGSIMIWGTLEARVQGADLVILGGLNEGSWPEAANPDPWLNRKLRHDAGLLLPERRIGLSAHDFQQAVAAPEVWLTRAKRSDEADTVPSRWLNRTVNLLGGLPDQGGVTALAEMRRRGEVWLNWASVLDTPVPSPASPRPSPRPPLIARPRRLTVTEIPRLIRDPYAIYAKHILRLRRLDALLQEPDALLRGTVIHKVLEDFIKAAQQDPETLSAQSFLDHAKTILEQEVPWPVARLLWLTRLRKVAEDFVSGERIRLTRARPSGFETSGSVRLSPLDFEISAKADRIDVDERGGLYIYDYKTGDPPSENQQKAFEKQLLIEAAMAEHGAFAVYGAAQVERALYIGLKPPMKEVAAPLHDEPPTKVWAELHALIEAYFDYEQGYSSRRMVHRDDIAGDYDHLARFGEWDRSAEPRPEDLT